jgi:D-glycero-alpha-D-manno-heptose-7-phosphate kinase
MAIISKTPVRIAFGGGGTDVEPYPSDYGGYVINSTINLYFRCLFTRREDNLINIYSNDTFFPHKFDTIKILKKRPQRSNLFEAVFCLTKPNFGLDVYVHGEPPKKAGLGASASLSTCLISGILNFEGKELNLDNIAEQAYAVEQNILKNIGGRQDQYAAVYGGFNGLKFLGESNVQIQKLRISYSFKKEIEKNLILFYTGLPRTSGNIVKEQVKSYVQNKAESKIFLDKLKEIAYQMKDALLSENFKKFGNLLTEDLEIKTKFNPLLTTNYMKQLNNLILKNGGIGGRVCGAGGGGCMIWLIEPKFKEKIKTLLEKQQGKLIEFIFVDKGLEILDF